jgi:hypothetical protein
MCGTSTATLASVSRIKYFAGGNSYLEYDRQRNVLVATSCAEKNISILSANSADVVAPGVRLYHAPCVSTKDFFNVWMKAVSAILP